MAQTPDAPMDIEVEGSISRVDGTTIHLFGGLVEVDVHDIAWDERTVFRGMEAPVEGALLETLLRSSNGGLTAERVELEESPER